MSDLGAPEQRLVNQYPSIAWLEPQLVTIPGRISGLTCRFCTALHGLKASEISRTGFATVEEFRRHVDQMHRGGGIPAGAEKLGPGIYATADGMHIDEAEFIRAAGGDPANPAHRSSAERILRSVCKENGIPYEERDS